MVVVWINLVFLFCRYVVSGHHLYLLVTRLHNSSPASIAPTISLQAVRKGLYGLRGYSISGSGGGSGNDVSSVTASVAVRGRGLGNVPQEVYKYVEYMTTLLLLHPQKLSGESAALVLYGLHGLGSGEEAVRKLLHVVSHKTERNSKQGVFSAMQLSQSLYALQHMDCEHREVVRLLRLLARELTMVSPIVECVGVLVC